MLQKDGDIHYQDVLFDGKLLTEVLNDVPIRYPKSYNSSSGRDLQPMEENC